MKTLVLANQLGRRLALLPLLVLASCGTDDKPTTSYAAASKLAVAVPCSFTDPSNVCQGVISKNPVLLSYGEVVELKKGFDQKHGKYRQVACGGANCATEQHANTYVNPTSRDFPDFSTLGENSVLVGYLQVKKGRPERLYSDGSPYQPDPGTDKAMIYVFAKKTSNPSWSTSDNNSAQYGTVVAEWVAIVYDHRKKLFTQIREGPIVKCAGSHGDPTRLDAGFLSCRSASRVHEIATSLGLSFEDATSCIADYDLSEPRATVALSRCLTDILHARADSTQTDLQKAKLRVASAIEQIAQWKDDAAVATFWFSCLAGCCTADAILQ
jgi:hypothetical protein